MERQKIHLWLVLTDCNFSRKNVFQWKGVLCEVSWFFFWGIYNTFVDLSERKKITETFLVWSVSETFVFLINIMLISSNSLLTTPLPLNVVLEQMKPHVILIYSLIFAWNYLIDWNLSQCLLFIIWTRIFYVRDII